MVCCNSRKSATLQKSVFQNGLRFEKGAIYEEIDFVGIDTEKEGAVEPVA